MLGKVLAVVYNIPAHTGHTRGICNSVGTLVVSSLANGTFCGGRDIFSSGRAKFAINVFANILAVVCNVKPHVTRHTHGICNSVGTLVLSNVANGTFCGGRDIFFAGGATFAIVHRVVFGFSTTVVYNVSPNASGTCDGCIYVSVGLVLATWTYGTIEKGSNGCTFDVTTAWTFVSTTGVIGFAKRSSVPTSWTSRTGSIDGKGMTVW